MMQVKDHDVSAFERLLDRYERRVFGFFWRLGSNTEEARDYTQETFLRLWKGRGRYSPKGKFSTYLFQIAKNYLLNERQKQRSRANTERGYADLQKLSTSRCASDEILTEELERAVGEAVSRLPQGHRLVWVLSEHQGMSYKEIGQVLDCSPATVCTRKAQAVEKLQAILAPLGDESDSTYSNKVGKVPMIDTNRRHVDDTV